MSEKPENCIEFEIHPLRHGVVVVTPTYNEVENIEPLIRRLESLDCADWILVVDDSSVDGTLEKLIQLQKEYKNIFVHQRPRRLGFGTAVRDGFQLSLGRVPFTRLVQMDADLSHDPAMIPRMLDHPHDIVIGSRYADGGKIVGWGSYRKALSKGANSLVKFMLRLRVHDITSGFKVYSRRAVQIITEEANRGSYEFEVETIWLAKKHGLTVTEIPITFNDRRAGKSKLSGFNEVKRLVVFTLQHLRG